MDDTRERIVALEVKVDHLSDQLRQASRKLDDIHEDWQAMKGARWVLVGVASVAATISGLIVKFWPFVK